jgi:hypothetical protein
MIVANVGAGCGGRGSVAARFMRADERCDRVRRSRVVLTPRCWRQALERLTLLGGDGVNKPGRRGEHEISRKTIARGRPDCLR